ncbi:MAG: hypothetical protein HON70_36975 [Lentisphaerae bacterium]|nr:hypothetical protein [Lentisphaerota bacterium]
MAKLKAGDTLYLLPGIYREALRLTDLVSDGRPTTIRAYGKGEVVLDGEGATEGGLKLVACRNVSIQGLRIRGAAGQALRIQNSSVVRIEENEFVDNPGTAIHVVGDSVDVRVLHNTIAFNGGTGVVSAPAARGLWVVSNIIRENASSLSLPDGPPPELFADYNNVTDAPAAATGPHDVDLPPGFADAARRDLRLSRISLCRGRGYLDRAIGAQRLEPAAGDDLAATKLRALAVTATTADLAWSIAGGKATMIVAYGTAPDQLTNVIVRDTGHWYRRHHTTTLQGLEPGSRYYVRVGYRQLLDGPAPYHSFRYLWPERTPAGEAEYYATLARRDIMGTELLSFVTRTENVVTGRELHVTVTGSDAAPGTAEAPLRSIVCACRMVQPGDRVLVHEGTYTELLRPSRSGLPGHPIVFEAAPGQRVELSGGRELIPYGADLRDRHHVVLRGFVFSGQSELDADRGGFGHVAVVGASDILVERCLFDGRMNYVNAIQIHRSREVTIHNNLFVSHHASMMVYDNPGTVTITRNSLLGPTLAKIYGPRNERLVIRNNLFGEHLFPKKKKQYKLKLPLVKEIDADYNLYYFDPANDERRLIDYMPPIPDPSAITAQPEDDPSKKRMGVKGDLEAWRTIFKQGRHSFIADPKWAKPEAVKAARSRSRGWPNRFFKYEPLRRADFAIAADSPCIGAGENGVTVGADTSY